MICLTASRYTMMATVRRGAMVNDQIEPGDTETGHFVRKQDPDTGEMTYVWVFFRDQDGDGEKDPAPENDREYNISCQAKAFTDTGYRSASNTEEFDKGIYRVYEYVEMRFAPNINLSRRDAVTAIRDKRTGKLLWAEEDVEIAEDGAYPATSFDVIGVNPVVDPFGMHIENVTVLKRAPGQ